MINKGIIKWALISFLLRMLPLPVIGLIIYWLVISPKGLLFYIMLPVTIFFIIILYFVLLIIFAGFVVKIKGPVKEGIYDFNSKELDAWRAQVAFMELVHWVQRVFSASPNIFIPVFRYFLNSKIGKGVTTSGFLFNPALIELGDNAFIGFDATILDHFITNGKVFIKKVRIGDNCTIGTRSVISPGATIKNNTIIGACSLVTKNKTLGPNKVYAGIPAKELKKKAK